MAVISKTLSAIIGSKEIIKNNKLVGTNSAKFVSVTGKGVVNPGLKNYASDPFFLKKAAEAKAEIDRVGLPKTKN